MRSVWSFSKYSLNFSFSRKRRQCRRFFYVIIDYMQDLMKKLKTLEADFLQVYEKLKISDKLAVISKLEVEVAEPEIWRDVKKATEKNQKLSELRDETEPWELLKVQISDLKELMDDESLKEEISEQLLAMEKEFLKLKKELRFRGKYDNDNAIIRITSGAGGTEAMDWSGMLERMYLRFCEKKGFKVSCLERTEGEEAGIKTAVY